MSGNNIAVIGYPPRGRKRQQQQQAAEKEEEEAAEQQQDAVTMTMRTLGRRQSACLGRKQVVCFFCCLKLGGLALAMKKVVCVGWADGTRKANNKKNTSKPRWRVVVDWARVEWSGERTIQTAKAERVNGQGSSLSEGDPSLQAAGPKLEADDGRLVEACPEKLVDEGMASAGLAGAAGVAAELVGQQQRQVQRTEYILYSVQYTQR